MSNTTTKIGEPYIRHEVHIPDRQARRKALLVLAELGFETDDPDLPFPYEYLAVYFHGDGEPRAVSGNSVQMAVRTTRNTITHTLGEIVDHVIANPVKKVKVTVTVNGETVSPTTLSEESWAALRNA